MALEEKHFGAFLLALFFNSRVCLLEWCKARKVKTTFSLMLSERPAPALIHEHQRMQNTIACLNYQTQADLSKKKKFVKPMNVAVSWFDITSIFQLFQNPEHVSKAKGLNSNIIIKLKESWGSSQNPCIICDYQFACSLLLTYPLCMQDTHFSWRIDSWCYRNVKKRKGGAEGYRKKNTKDKGATYCWNKGQSGNRSAINTNKHCTLCMNCSLSCTETFDS